MSSIPQPAFQIAPTGWPQMDTQDYELVIDAGHRHFNYAILDPVGKKILVIQAHDIRSGGIIQWLKDAKELPVCGMTFSRIRVFFNLPDSVLVPHELYRTSENEKLINIVHGDLLNGSIMEEEIQDMGFYHVYRIPQNYLSNLLQLFPDAEIAHIYSCLLRNLVISPDDPDQFRLFFYSHSILVILIRKGRFHLIQSYPYDLPEDVSYQLLNICEQVKLDPASVHVFISGGVDPDSSLYAEVLKYFLEVEWMHTTGDYQLNEVISGHPDHYFHPYTLMATCE